MSLILYVASKVASIERWSLSWISWREQEVKHWIYSLHCITLAHIPHTHWFSGQLSKKFHG